MKTYLKLIISITSIVLLNQYLVEAGQQIKETKKPTNLTLNNNLTCPDRYCNLGAPHPIDNDDSKNSANWISKYAGQSNKNEEHPVMNDGYLRQSSIIFGLTKTATYDRLSSLCYKQMKEIGRAILRKDVWAMKGKFDVIYLIH